MDIKLLPLAEIKPYENNPRIADQTAISSVAESISAYGFQQPIVVDKNLTIIAGHTRYKAALTLGLTEVPCVVAENLSEEQVRAYRLADNKTNDLASWDSKKLFAELDEMAKEGNEWFSGFGNAGVVNTTSVDAHSIDKSLVDALVQAPVYFITCRSQDKEKIDKVEAFWATIADGTDESETE